ncbi:hypothetical protein JYT57_00170 [Nitrosarchaeum koreense]|nr:hypothetical protein [Nitrosarchaeum koreense]
MHYQCPECDKEGTTVSELKKNGCNCKLQPWSMLDPNDSIPSKNTKSKQDKLKFEIAKIKGKIGSNYVESILVDDKPHFLCNVNDELKLAEKITDGDIVYRPLGADECGYFPYKYDKTTLNLLKNNPPSKEELLQQIKSTIDDFIDISERDKCLIMGDLLLSYCQEWIDTLHFPFFVGETESGKSTALHLFRWLGYRCLYGEDIPNADIYNFLGTDEEATGTICEDEAQEIAVNREKIRTYKNSYSRGALKPRILSVDSRHKRQVFYKTFCLKLFAGERVPEDKGFKERLAIIHMTEGSPKFNVKRLNDDQKLKLHNLRNRLLLWKVLNFNSGLKPFQSTLKKRDQELWEDFLSITHDTKYFDACKNVVDYYTKQRHQSIWNSLESRLFKLVIDKINDKLSIRLESFWYYLTQEQDDLMGHLDKETFYPHDFTKKITRNFLSKLFDEKFQGKKTTKYETIGERKHQRTEYIFDSKVILKLAQKYNIPLSIDSVILCGQRGGSGEHPS